MRIVSEIDLQTAVEPTKDSALIQRAQAGDTRAWEALVGRHQSAVFRLAYLILRDGDEAEDAAQDAMIRAYRYLKRVDPAQGIRPWLLRITRNVAVNRQRSLSRYWQMTRRFFQTAAVVGDGRYVEDVAQQHEAEQLWQAIQQLKPKARDVVYLRYFLELSEAETAAALGIPPGTVKSRLARALKTLQGIIERDYPALREGWRAD